MSRWSSIRRKPVLLTAVACMLLAVVLHAPVLRLAAGLLIDDDPSDSSSAVLVAGGDRCFDVAGQLYAEQTVRSVLIWQSLPGRLELIGVRPLTEEITRDELIARNVAPESIALLQIVPDAGLNPIERLDRWLTEHPQDQVLILCDRFNSRLWRLRLNGGVSEANRWRVKLRALPDRRYDETNWWRSRVGIKAWFRAAFEQMYFRVRGAEPQQQVDYDPDLYERRVFGG